MEKWIAVVTHPLGLAGFALFLVFGVAARFGMRKGGTWLPVAAVAMAIIALAGGLLLSWQSNEARSTSASAPGTASTVQHTTGDRSPAVQGVSGNVTITIDKAGK